MIEFQLEYANLSGDRDFGHVGCKYNLWNPSLQRVIDSYS